jgi:hypothetical protein
MIIPELNIPVPAVELLKNVGDVQSGQALAEDARAVV